MELGKMRVECPRTLTYMSVYFFLSNLLDKAYYPDGALKVKQLLLVLETELALAKKTCHLQDHTIS